MTENHEKEKCHELCGMQRKNHSSRPVGEVIAKKTDGTRAPPLLLENQVVEIVIDIDQKAANNTARCRLCRAGRCIGHSAERKSSGKVSSGHHSDDYGMLTSIN